MASGLENEFATLHEIVKAAKIRLNPNIWDYLIGGTETETTLRRNRMALDSIAFKPRVLRNVSHDRSLVGDPRQEDPPAGHAGAGRLAGILRARRRHHRRQGRRRGQRRDADQLGDDPQARGHRQGRRRPQDLPALCARRRQLGGRSRQAGDGCGLRRLLHHRRHPGLFAARARHRQALREVVAHRGDRPGPSGGLLVGQFQAGEGQVPRREVHAEGHRHRRGRRDRLPARRVGRLLLQPWRPPARPRPRFGGGAAGGDRRGEGHAPRSRSTARSAAAATS